MIMSANIYSAAVNCDVNRIINPISNCAYPGSLEIYERVTSGTDLLMNQFLITEWQREQQLV